MQSYGMTLLIRDEPGAVERYREYHRQVWPEVAARLREIGVESMKIYLIGRRLFMYMEAVDGFDPEREFPRLADDPRYREWEELMAGLQEPAPEAAGGDGWAVMDVVFDLGRQ